MAIDLSIVGKTMGPYAFTYDQDTVILYALGIGAGVEELDFVYERNLKVYPTFAVVPFMPVLMSQFLPMSGINIYALLHGEQKIILHREIPPAATVHTAFTCESVWDKGDKGAMVNVRLETVDESGALLFENRTVLVDRSAGNFGGDRGPKAVPVVPPEGTEPDVRVEHAVPDHQAALYRLSGDKNTLHIDPEIARKAGFDRPILHGLCTFGYAGRAVLHEICGGDPARLRSFGVRFVRPVYPGDTLTTEGWRADDAGTYIIRTSNQDGTPVLANAVAEVQ